MEERNLLFSPPEKVLLMYQAVLDMVGEGCDINRMKVSDITARAGIGKGTAYEYFSSKEEIISNAIAYDVEKKRESLFCLVAAEGSFSEKFDKILDYIMENFHGRQTFCLLVRIGTGSYEISDSLRKEYERMKQTVNCARMDDVVDQFMEQGVREGIIGERNIYLQRMAFAAQVVAFASCLVGKSRGKAIELTVGEAKAFAYDSLVKSLN